MANVLAALIAVLAAMLVATGLILWAGESPAVAWTALVKGAVGSKFNFYETLVTATPLVLTGLAVAVAFRAKLYNIGAEGQLYIGAAVATWFGLTFDELPGAILIPLIMLGGFVAGGLWLLVPTILKLRFKVDEVVTTLLLNFVAILLVTLLVQEVWRDPVQTDVSRRLARQSDLPTLVEASRLHAGALVALVMVAVVWLLMSFSTLGYRIRAVGSNLRAARFGGIQTTRVVIVTALISGGIAGLAGVGELLGLRHQLSTGLSAGYGFTGIVIAMLARLHPVGVLASGLFFSAVITGSENLGRSTEVPSYLGDVIQALCLLFILTASFALRYRIRRS